MDFQLSNSVEAEELWPGDHVYCYRVGYAHHGIFVGDGGVIHYLGNKSGSHGSWCQTCWNYEENKKYRDAAWNGMGLTCLNCFLRGKTLKKFRYGVSAWTRSKSLGGTCSQFPSDDVAVVLDRAWNILRQGFGDYNLLSNNCEVFAFHCKTGALPTPPGIRSGSIYCDAFCDPCKTGFKNPSGSLVGKRFACPHCRSPLTISANSTQIGNFCTIM